MSVSDKINEFIIIAKKLMVLKKVELSNTEPRVSVVYLPSGEIIYTFISSLFPFFTHRSFETVKEGEIDMLLKKCKYYSIMKSKIGVDYLGKDLFFDVLMVLFLRLL